MVLWETNNFQAPDPVFLSFINISTPFFFKNGLLLKERMKSHL